jgi:hypothetical protein
MAKSDHPDIFPQIYPTGATQHPGQIRSRRARGADRFDCGDATAPTTVVAGYLIRYIRANFEQRNHVV